MKPILITFLSLYLTGTVQASGPHVHGQAYMTLELEGQSLLINATMSAHD